MRRITLALTGFAGMGLACGTASADFVDVTLTNLGDIGGGGNTWQVYANFDAPDDVILAVGGIQGLQALSFSSTTPLINDGASAFAGLKAEDFGSAPFGAAWDSYVGIGTTAFAGNDSDYSPGFAGSDGISNIISGTSFSETDGGYFDGNPSSPEGGVGGVLIGNFTVAGDFTYEGVVNWRDSTLPAGQFFNSVFSVTTMTVPAPGAMALLGLAGLVGSRRRRR